MEQATFAAGCFWGIEAHYAATKGVTETAVGYMGGMIHNPSYEMVCTGQTGHAEVVHLTFDPAIISYETLVEMFWTLHNPTQLNYQGPDHGTQYRSAIFYYSESQRETAISSMQQLEASDTWENPVVTLIQPAAPFYRAEEYHQQYLAKRGQTSCGI